MNKPFLIPTTLVTASCLVAMLYGCGGCAAGARDDGDVASETVSESKIQDLPLDTAETGDTTDTGFGTETDTGFEVGKDRKSPPQSPVSHEEPCTVVVDSCCWCFSANDFACVVGLDAIDCAEIGGQVVQDCVFMSYPPDDFDGPLCQFQCV